MSRFKTPEGEAQYRAAYAASLRLWPAEHESLDIPTRFGLTHVIGCGEHSGDPVLLLPAMSLSATMWYATVPALCREFRCFAVDFPSDMGLSAGQNPPASRAGCVAWLREVLDRLSIVRASIIGASYGGFLALNYAIAEPKRMKKLVLVSPAAGIVALPRSFYARMFLALLVPGRPAVERIMDWIFADRFPLDSPVIQQVIVGSKSLKPQIKVYPIVFKDGEIAGLSMPVCLLLGEKEVCYSSEAAAKRARQMLPRAVVEIVPNVGHLLVMERPDIVNPRISRFLLDQEPAQRELREKVSIPS